MIKQHGILVAFILIFGAAACLGQATTYSYEEGVGFHRLNTAWASAGTYQSKEYYRSVIDSINAFLAKYPHSVYNAGVYSYKLDLVSTISSDKKMIGAIADSLLAYDPLVQTKLGVADVLIRRNIDAGRGAALLRAILPELTVKSQRYRALTLLAQHDIASGDIVSGKEELRSAVQTDSTRMDAWYQALALARAREETADVGAIERQIARLERSQLLQFSEETTKSPNLFRDLSTMQFKDMDGRTVSLSSYKNKVVVLDFFAFWCGACFPGLPDSFKRLSREFRGVVFLYVNASGPMLAGTPEAVTKELLDQPRFRFLKTQTLLFPQNEIGEAVKLKVVPTTLILDKQGVVRFDYAGYTKGSEDVMRRSLRLLINEK